MLLEYRVHLLSILVLLMLPMVPMVPVVPMLLVLMVLMALLVAVVYLLALWLLPPKCVDTLCSCLLVGVVDCFNVFQQFVWQEDEQAELGQQEQLEQLEQLELEAHLDGVAQADLQVPEYQGLLLIQECLVGCLYLPLVYGWVGGGLPHLCGHPLVDEGAQGSDPPTVPQQWGHSMELIQSQRWFQFHQK